MDKIRVILADDHTILREGIRTLLQRTGEIDVVAEADDGEMAVAQVTRLLPDVVLMDIGMPRVNGLEATKQIKQRFPQIKVLILTVYDTGQYLSQMLQAGVSGYIVKTASGTELISAIKAVSQGNVYLYPSIARLLVGDYMQKVKSGEERLSYEGLTKRERQILTYIAEDKRNKEIADLLNISGRTVQSHRTNLMEKLGAHDRTELVKYALRKGIISLYPAK